jgi:bisphosphoglycerate-dependent phosphoglycerate mutase
MGRASGTPPGIFTGWENAHFTAAGEEEAIRAETLLAEHGIPCYP